MLALSFNLNFFEVRRSNALELSARVELKLTPAGRSLLSPSRFTSVPSVVLYGGAVLNEATPLTWMPPGMIYETLLTIRCRTSLLVGPQSAFMLYLSTGVPAHE